MKRCLEEAEEDIDLGSDTEELSDEDEDYIDVLEFVKDRFTAVEDKLDSILANLSKCSNTLSVAQSHSRLGRGGYSSPIVATPLWYRTQELPHKVPENGTISKGDTPTTSAMDLVSSCASCPDTTIPATAKDGPTNATCSHVTLKPL